MAKKEDDSKLFAFLAVLLSIVGFIIALVAKKNDRYVMYYAKQSLVLFIAWIIIWVVDMVLVWIPVIGWLIMVVLNVGMVVLWVIGLIYSLSGSMKPIPIVGKYASKINL